VANDSLWRSLQNQEPCCTQGRFVLGTDISLGRGAEDEDGLDWLKKVKPM